jgi:two-component system LytT family response regulator
MKLRVLVVDDEPLARSRILELLTEERDVEVVGQCRNGIEAVKSIQEQQPDLVFLDIKMPGLDGFEVLRSLDPARLPAVIFVTAYDKHAVEAFDVHAVDYLLKPYQPERFKRSLQRARELVRDEGKVLTARLTRLLEAESRTYLSRFSIRAGGRISFVPVKEVDWIESAGNYLLLHVGKENHLLRETLNGLETKLPPKAFVRVNRSALVNLERIKALESDGPDTHVLTLRSGAKLPVTRSVRELEELLKFG